MNTQDIQMKLNGLKEIELEPIKGQVNSFIDTLPRRSAEAVDQVKRRLGLKPRSRREVIAEWLDHNRWLPIALGAGFITTLVLLTRSRVHDE